MLNFDGAETDTKDTGATTSTSTDGKTDTSADTDNKSKEIKTRTTLSQFTTAAKEKVGDAAKRVSNKVNEKVGIIIDNLQNELIKKLSENNLNEILKIVDKFKESIAEQIISKISDERSNDIFFKDSDPIRFVKLYFITSHYENYGNEIITLVNLGIIPPDCTIDDLKKDKCKQLNEPEIERLGLKVSPELHEEIIRGILKYIHDVNKDDKRNFSRSSYLVDGGGKKRKTRRNKKSKKARKSKRRH